MPFKIFFKPLLIPTLVTGFLLVLVFSLGTWQLYRKAWKENLLQKEDLVWRNPPILWQESQLLFHKYTKIQDFPARQYELKGCFLEELVILVPSLLPSFSKSKRNLQARLFSFMKQKKFSFYGYKIIQPFLLENGEIIWVDRGWIPTLSVMPQSKKEIVFIRVRLEEEQKPAFLQRKMGMVNVPTREQWIYFSPKEASQAYDIKSPYNFYAIETSYSYSPQGFFPIPMLEKKHLRNHHLTYAFIWYSLGALISLLYLIFHNQQGRLKFLWSV